MPEIFKYVYYTQNRPLIYLETALPLVRDFGVNVVDVERLQVTDEELAILRRLGLVDITDTGALQSKMKVAIAAEKKTNEPKSETLRNKVARFLDLLTYT